MGTGARGAVAPTTTGMLRHWAERDPDHTALRWEGGRMTYAQLDARSNQAANALVAAGVERGDRVAYLDKNSPEQVELYFGAVKIGAVPTPVNFRLAPPEIAFVVADARAEVLAVGAELLPTIDRVVDDLGGARVVSIGGEGGGAGPTYAAWRDAFPPDDPAVPIDAGDIAYQLYSSGTTGRPKGVLLSHANLVAETELLRDVVLLDAGSVSLVPMPLFHIGGGGYLLAGLARGATCVLVRDIVPPALVDTLEREQVTHTFVVPAVIQLLVSVPGVAERDFSALRCLAYGASPISERVLADAVRTFRCPLLQVYGLTETTGAVVYLPAADHDLDGPHRHRLRAAGVPAPGIGLRVVDPATGTDLATGQVGEIWIRGPVVMHGYWNQPEATGEAVAGGGWLRSGDAGYLDEDGYLYLYDRVKDMIVSGGENIYPAEVENVLMAHPAVADAAVIGIPDDRWGEVPLALVVRREGGVGGVGGVGGGGGEGAVTEEELVGWCRERLAGFKCPRRIEWAQALPRNPSGKILKKDLRAPYWEGRDRMVG